MGRAITADRHDRIKSCLQELSNLKSFEVLKQSTICQKYTVSASTFGACYELGLLIRQPTGKGVAYKWTGGDVTEAMVTEVHLLTLNMIYGYSRDNARKLQVSSLRRELIAAFKDQDEPTFYELIRKIN